MRLFVAMQRREGKLDWSDEPGSPSSEPGVVRLPRLYQSAIFQCSMCSRRNRSKRRAATSSSRGGGANASSWSDLHENKSDHEAITGGESEGIGRRASHPTRGSGKQ